MNKDECCPHVANSARVRLCTEQCTVLAEILHFSWKLLTMPDNKKDVGKRDDIRVDANDPSEVEYVHSKFPDKTHEEIREAIKNYSPMRVNIERHLRQKK